MVESPKPRSFLRNVALAFLVTLTLYALGFWGSQWYRARRGPWEVTFRSEDGGTAVVQIDQPRLGVHAVELRFLGAGSTATHPSKTVRFDSPQALHSPPFGTVIFLDTTILPGTVTFDLFGHEVELLPRVLIIDKQEYPWNTAGPFELAAQPPANGPE